jgi:hypothetical protein
MAAYEWIVVAYFSGLTLAAWLAPVGLTRRLQASALGVVVVGSTTRVDSSRFPDSRLLDAGAAGAVRARSSF